MADEALVQNTEIIPQAYRDTTVIRELPLDSWLTIIQKAPESSSVFADQELTYDLIHNYIVGENLVSAQFISALKTIFELGAEDGRTLLEQAAADIQLEIDSSDHESDRELAARLWVLSQSDIRFLDLLMRAHVSHEYSNRKISNIREYSGESGFPVDQIDTVAIQSLVSNWCIDNGKSEVVTINAYKKDNFWYCNITRGDPIKHVTEVKQKNLASFSYHPAVWDHVRIEPETGRIGISSRSPKLIATYREVFGTVLTGKGNYFSHEKVCSLEPLQAQGKSLFDLHKPINLRFVNLTELKWQGGNGSDTFIVKGKDCFKVLDDLQVNIQVGELTEAKLSFNFYGLPRSIIVIINPPYRIVVPDGVNQDEIFTYLNKLGLRGRFDHDVDRKTFWELSPWVYPETYWRNKIGGDFDTLKKANCLNEISLDTVIHPDHNIANGALTVEKISANTFVGVSANIDVGVRTLTATDRIGFKLDLLQIGSLIRSELSLQGNVQEVTGGIFSLGKRELSPALRVQIYLVCTQPNEESERLITHNASGAKPILIVPNDSSYQSNNVLLRVSFTGLSFNGIITDIVRALGVENQVPLNIWLPHNLIIDCIQNNIWVHGEKIERINAASQPFKFALRVAEANGGVVKKDELNSYLSPSSDDPKVASKAKSDFMKAVKERFLSVGKPLPDEIFSSPSGGYQLKCSCYIHI